MIYIAALPALADAEVATIRAWSLPNLSAEREANRAEEPDSADLVALYTLRPRRDLVADILPAASGYVVHLVGWDGDISERPVGGLEGARDVVVAWLSAGDGRAPSGQDIAGL